ncbi:MAG TPA: host attachment protein [Opitutaceae bacterium]|nr:host attachment protein [Opitutaceae bacterium]
MRLVDLEEEARNGPLHFVVALDRCHVRIYLRQRRPETRAPRLLLADAVDLPEGRFHRFADRVGDEAGRFPRAPGIGGGIDERLPSQREEERRNLEELAQCLESFFRCRAPGATWDLAAPQDILASLAEHLGPEARSGLQHQLGKDLVKEPAEALLAHFGRP